MKYALIAGAGSGLAQVVIDAIKDEFFIFALDKNPIINNLYNHENVFPFVVDITDSTTLNNVKAVIEKKTSTLDLIINFAGIVILGSVIETTPELFNDVLQVNLLGMYKINHTFFPLIEQAKGRIINISSEYGQLLALPFHAPYTVSKHAIEVYSDALRREVARFGVRVIKIRPGAFKTPMQTQVYAQFNDLLNETKHFKQPLTKMQKLMVGELKKAKSPHKVLKTFKKAIRKKHPKHVYNVCHSFKMKLLNILPSPMQDWLLNSFFSA
ncbi:MAG: SDR family NAD(P)-dependent oxidoreductase [Bacilli bacterium]|jgi:NAD(P)-dependent dehydrogenase (short-subunit alcohol dehydrogenase family)|nr:SDR family NAD(P)-dependent oxidoreductase [Bacilli bacterium]MDD3389487.1 SDR family NAD(P)-dependent oxidoreductase [Bacilli bacterium]MDD4345109.1 SDR family NAD(P)-dependent oxidoreductase [Bacilli bacterium]MDD4521140.1 SDR family NAD(P)-dependent oxidoreductase [Bacilli bacterium]MDY0399856.1 SDR family NAD(P)-dependent oxidoreductase [Bacilli bacterium]